MVARLAAAGRGGSGYSENRARARVGRLVDERGRPRTSRRRSERLGSKSCATTPIRRRRYPPSPARPSLIATSCSKVPTAIASRPSRLCRTRRRTSGVVILPDVRGLYRFYEELTLRFAERGHAAVAIDYFGRTAGLGKRDDDFEYMPHVEQTTQRGIQSDVAAAVGYLRSPEGGACTAIFTVGFCFGGRNSWLAAAGDHGLAGAIGFYGRPGAGRDGSPGPSARAEELAAPLLALMGGDDPGHPDRGHHRLRRGAGRRRCRPRGGRLPGCSAQLLRPQAGGVRRSVGGCLGTRAPVHRAPRAGRVGRAR